MSGLPTRRFAFEAFLPRDKKERAAILQELKDETRTIIIYEAPHHLVKTLEELYDTLGDRQISICRELTKRYEEKMRTTLSDSLVYYGENEPRGEYVLVIHGKTFEELAEEARKSWEDMSLEEHMQVYESQGTPRKEAMKLVTSGKNLSDNPLRFETVPGRSKALPDEMRFHYNHCQRFPLHSPLIPETADNPHNNGDNLPVLI